MMESASTFLLGRLGSYRLKHLLGTGATSQVYLAEHIFLKRAAAIKILTCDFAEWPDFDLEIFENTAVGAARLNHPNIVTLYDIDEERARPFLVMEYVDGQSLHALLRKKGRLSPTQALSILCDVARALRHAHAEGIVHCDIKPGNILIDRKGNAKVTDFGLSRALNQAERGSLDGMVAGTPAYISPEQVLARRPDQRSDLYSLGATLFEMLTGEAPFRGSSDSALFDLHLTETRGMILNRLPAEAGPLRQVVGRLLARYPKDRYQTAGELLADLRFLFGRAKVVVRPPPDIHAHLIRIGERRSRPRPGGSRS
ncbi:MAG: serine/threonine protein kinase [Planctomycetaceae bacterium]|nr:serine/threonine protein kinase [Planctomycetaceae bacterium]